MDRASAISVDGIGAVAATAGVRTQLQGRIFALLYLTAQPLALEGVDNASGAFTQGKAVDVGTLQNVIPFAAPGRQGGST